MPPSIARSSRRALLALGVALVTFVALGMPGGALAGNGPVELTLRPIGQPGQFFDITMRPGETRRLEVEIANVGDVPLIARTYATDVYTIVNGGFGARLRDEPATGMTRWVEYPAQVYRLGQGASARRTFSVAVPPDAEPGEYAASLVLENDQPIRGSGTVILDEFIRHAIAVVVTVPGQRSPALTIGDASYSAAAGHAKVTVAVENPGNVRLKPIVGFVLIDERGVELRQTSVAMDTFYADTATFVEIPLDELLAPGVYTVRLTLDDAGNGVRVDMPAIPLLVDAPPSGTVVGGGVPLLSQVIPATGEGGVGLSVTGVVLVTGLMLSLVGVWSILRSTRRRWSARRGEARSPRRDVHERDIFR